MAACPPTRHRHWRRVGSRASTRKRSSRGDRLFLSLPTPAMTCRTKKGNNTAVDFNFFLSFFRFVFVLSSCPFRICSMGLLCSSPLLQMDDLSWRTPCWEEQRRCYDGVRRRWVAPRQALGFIFFPSASGDATGGRRTVVGRCVRAAPGWFQ